MSLFKKKDRVLLAGAVLIGGINAALAAFISILLQQIIDVATQKDLSGFSDLFIIMLIYLAALGIMGFLEAFLGKLLLRNVSRHLRDDIFRGVITKEPVAYTSRNTADYLSALVNDVKLVEENYLTPLMLCSQMVVLFLTTLGILFYLSPVITGILLVFLVLMFLIPALLGKQMQKRQDAYSEKLAEFTAKAKDYLNGYEVIRGYSMHSYIFKKYRTVNKETAKKKFAADTLLAVNECISDILSSLSVIVIVFAAAYLLLKGQITMGTLLALIQLSSMFVTPVVMLMQNIPKVSSMKPVLEHLAQYAEAGRQLPDSVIPSAPASRPEPSRNAEKTAVQRPAVFRDSLVCHDVTFHYQDGPDVLKNLNLCIEAGKKYALLGESGCGKSTLIKLLTGYSGGFQGEICYDGRSVMDFTQSELNRLVSVIHQNVFLFDADIYTNICLGECFLKEELEAALENSGVSQFLPGLSQGIYSPVGENGSLLSGGQRQRVAVARALIRHTPILIIDEGTSAVDQQTAYEIESRLLEQKELTVITITHHMNPDLENRYDDIFHLKAADINFI